MTTRYLIVRSRRIGYRLALPALGSLSIGRDPACDIVLDDQNVEHQHALLFLDHGIGIRVLADDSARIVRLAKSEREAPLTPGKTIEVEAGDRFRLGAVELSFFTPKEEVTASEQRVVQPALGGSGSFIAGDPTMQTVLALIDRIAKASSHVLIQGETGTGKDRVAQMLHDRSPRSSAPFVCVKSVDLSDSFFEESEKSVIASARGGTIYLDEVGGLSPRAQLALGHLLDRATEANDVRFLASSNDDLEASVQAGTFRKDLYFRLNGVVVDLPSLRERPADIIALAELFLSLGRSNAELTPAAKRVLERHPWPGNVRELKNVIERALLLTTEPVIDVIHLPADSRAAPTEVETADVSNPRPKSLREEIEALEKKRILEALQQYPTQRDAAAALDMPMRTFLNRLDQFGIPRARGGGTGNKDS